MRTKSKDGLFLKKHSQWPPESFRPRRGLRARAVLFLPWMLIGFSFMDVDDDKSKKVDLFLNTFAVVA
ncbi:hypothetical protein QJS04_geneDACA006786 [Acorus gramineus]|uniref:Uncharacterized protein n=1 Tax=Acorus gramineus TaxID=55184 RepID=A0AAV9AXB3_ACOGR|nr:hypothetical protein QJS04_geneDACA006786 [Acorus gramineus]